MKKKPKFFCDFCGSEVPAKDKRCASCGKYFSAVRCPSCGFSGNENLFNNGCPICGYSSSDAKSNNIAQEVHKNSKRINTQEKMVSLEKLPLWVYLLTFVFLSIAVGMVLATL